MNTYTIQISEAERREVLHALAKMQADLQSDFTTRAHLTSAKRQQESRAKCDVIIPLWQRIRAAETDRKPTCGECAHIVPMNKQERISYNKEAFQAHPWGDCPIYRESAEFQNMLRNHYPGTGWSPAPSRYLDCPACEHFTPKK